MEDELKRLDSQELDNAKVTVALAEFEAVWDVLAPREQARILELLIERIDHDGKRGDISITFHPTGITALATELSEECAA